MKNLREYLRGMNPNNTVTVYYITEFSSLIFNGTVADARVWANRTWTYEVINVDYVDSNTIFYVKKLGE